MKKIAFSKLKKLVKESVEAEGRGDLTEVKNFGVSLLAYTTLVHLWHLNCEKDSQHVTLNDLYYNLEVYADKLIEAAIGKTNQPTNGLSFSYNNESVLFNDKSIETLVKIADEAAILSDKVKEPGIVHTLGDLIECLDKAVYKLRRLD